MLLQVAKCIAKIDTLLSEDKRITDSPTNFDRFPRYDCTPSLRQGSYSSGETWKTWKRGLFGKNQGKPGKLREFSDYFYNIRENSGNFILPNISDEIGCALRINE